MVWYDKTNDCANRDEVKEQERVECEVRRLGYDILKIIKRDCSNNMIEVDVIKMYYKDEIWIGLEITFI